MMRPQTLLGVDIGQKGRVALEPALLRTDDLAPSVGIEGNSPS